MRRSGDWIKAVKGASWWLAFICLTPPGWGLIGITSLCILGLVALVLPTSKGTVEEGIIFILLASVALQFVSAVLWNVFKRREPTASAHKERDWFVDRYLKDTGPRATPRTKQPRGGRKHILGDRNDLSGPSGGLVERQNDGRSDRLHVAQDEQRSASASPAAWLLLARQFAQLDGPEIAASTSSVNRPKVGDVVFVLSVRDRRTGPTVSVVSKVEGESPGPSSSERFLKLRRVGVPDELHDAGAVARILRGYDIDSLFGKAVPIEAWEAKNLMVSLGMGTAVERLNALDGERPPAALAPSTQPGDDHKRERVSDPSSGGQGWGLEAPAKRVVELYAMDLARRHYEQEGYSVDDVSQRESFDLRCERGGRTLRVEVKGTTSGASKVLITPAEHKHALEHFPNVALYLVSHIRLSEPSRGRPSASGGVEREVSPWDLRVCRVEPVTLACHLPPASA